MAAPREANIYVLMFLCQKIKFFCLIVLGLDLEIGLWVVADGTLLGSLLANHDMAAVRALPDYITIL